MIKGLLKKDLYNLASYKTTLIIVVLFCSMLLLVQMPYIGVQ